MSALSEERISFQTGIGQVDGKDGENVGKEIVLDVIFSNLNVMEAIGGT